jgi:antitoxin component YwqK of YwqJK toxin-antitoxin module
MQSEFSLTKYYDNGNLYYEYISKDGVVGDFKKYHDNGKLKEQRTYVKGKLEGKVITYHRNGKLKILVTYKDGKIQSLQK